MKNVSQIIAFIITCIFITGCSINEEITINPNGSMKYSYLLDADNFMKMVPDSTEQQKIVKDSVFSFAQLLKEKEGSIPQLPLEEQKELFALKPLSVKIHQDDKKKEFTVQLLGDFNNINALNSALSSLHALNQKKSQGISEEGLGLVTQAQYSWDGKIFKKKIVIPTQRDDSKIKDLTTMFSGGTYKVKYNFPGKIKKVSNPNAIISADKKSVTIKYNASDYILYPEKDALEIELEK